MANVPPPDWEELWKCIQLRTDWESPLPDRYLTPVVPTGPGPTYQLPTPDPARSAPPVVPTSAPAPARTPAPATAPTNTVERCVHFEDAFLPYKETGQRVRDVLKKATEKGHALPKNAQGLDMCVSYHVKGLCNTRCGRSADHRAHNAAETKDLLAWCVAAFQT